MKSMFFTTLPLMVAVFLPIAVQGQDAAGSVAAGKALERLVGTWKFTSADGIVRILKRESVLGGAFVESKVFDEQGKLQNIKMYAYDPKQGVYRNWWFLSGRNGMPVTMEYTGTYDETTRTLSFTTKRGAFEIVSSTRFVDEKNHAVAVSVKDAAGKVVKQTDGKSVRQE